MKTKKSYGSVKKAVLDLIQTEVLKGKTQFTYTEVHDFILDVVKPNWRVNSSTINEARYKYRGQHTGMFSNQVHSGAGFVGYKINGGYKSRTYNCLCSPNVWDSRHLVKIEKGKYEFVF